MSLIVLNLLYGFTAVVIGAVAASWFCWTYFHGKAQKIVSAEAKHAAEVLVCLQELATRVAVDVDDHSSRVEEINDKLTSPDEKKPYVIIDVVAQLIEANQQMQHKLATTEDKLRKQAREIQIHAAEARTDALTMLANRRAFDDELARRVAESHRTGGTFSMILADVDKFKDFNDSHGHQTGDEVLQGVAKLLRRTMREMDIVARYGGEEFAVILPGTILHDACKAATRAREAIEKCCFQHNLKANLQVTVSFGVAESLKNENGADFVIRADKALYAAKLNGRNCVYQFDGQSPRRFELAKPILPPKIDKQSQQESVSEKEEIEPVVNGKSAETTAEMMSAEYREVMSSLASRTNFCQQVRNRLAEWKRGGPTFSVVLLEVNQTEQSEDSPRSSSINLSALLTAKYLTSTIREMDMVAHYAPGSFALLLPTAGLVDAIRVAERLREGFSQYSLSMQSDKPKSTLSVGVVQVMESEESISLLKRAEAALDVATHRGGDRAYYHDGKKCAPITAMLETMDYLS